MDMRVKVRIPAIWPLRLRSAPTAMPRIILSISRNRLLVKLTSREFMVSQRLRKKSNITQI